MHLHEYQAKQLFNKYGLSVPLGSVFSNLFQLKKASYNFGIGPWVVKCQIHSGGRGKSNAVKIFNTKQDIINFANYWFNKRLVTYQTDNYGQLVNYILIESVINFSKEIYLGILIDRTINRVVFIASIEGGIEIEKQILNKLNIIHKVIIDPIVGPQIYQGRQLAFKLGLNGIQINQFVKVFMRLLLLFFECDLELLEINPLVYTKNNGFICLDGKISIDSNSLFRQIYLSKMRDINQENKFEVEASFYGLNYVTLDGNIGCIVNGAGLAMSTMDMIKLYGGNPANFLDIGGGVSEQCVTKAFEIIISDKKIKAILINIFGGIVRCDLVSDGIIKAILKTSVNIPIVVRLEGNNSKLGVERLINSGLNIINATTMSDAAKKVVNCVKEI